MLPNNFLVGGNKELTAFHNEVLESYLNLLSPTLDRSKISFTIEPFQ